MDVLAQLTFRASWLWYYIFSSSSNLLKDQEELSASVWAPKHNSQRKDVHIFGAKHQAGKHFRDASRNAAGNVLGGTNLYIALKIVARFVPLYIVLYLSVIWPSPRSARLERLPPLRQTETWPRQPWTRPPSPLQPCPRFLVWIWRPASRTRKNVTSMSSRYTLIKFMRHRCTVVGETCEFRPARTCHSKASCASELPV